MPRGWPFINLVGHTYGDTLKVVGYAGVRLDGRKKDHPNRTWTCKCTDCGLERVYRANDLRRGKSRCPCRRRNKCSDRLRTLYWLEKGLGKEAMAGLSKARELDESASIVKNMIGKP
jgi:hypothetical protein